MNRFNIRFALSIVLAYCFSSGYASMNHLENLNDISTTTTAIYSMSLDEKEQNVAMLSSNQLQEVEESILTRKGDMLMHAWWRQISSYLNCKSSKLHHINYYFFNVVTDYPHDRIKDVGFEPLKSMPQSRSKIQGFNIDYEKSENNIFDSIPSYILYSLIQKVKNFPNDNWPNIRYTKIDTFELKSDNGKSICNPNDNLKNTQIRTIILSNCSIDFGNFCQLIKNLANTQVCTLDLTSNHIGCSTDINQFKKLGVDLEKTKICNINFYENNIDDEFASQFIENSINPNIRTIKFGCNNISFEGACNLVKKSRDTEMNIFDLSFCQISAEDVCNFDSKRMGQFFEDLKNTRFYLLDLSGNKIGDKGACLFIKNLENIPIRTVNFSSTDLSDDGATKIVEYLKNTEIDTIDLSYNHEMSVNGAYQFVKKLKNTHVRTVYLLEETLKFSNDKSERFFNIDGVEIKIIFGELIIN